MRLYKHW